MATTPETPKSIPSAPSASASSAQPPFASFDPYAMWQQGQQTFTKLMTDSVTRWQAFADQYAAVEQQVSTHAQTAVTHWAQLAKDAIAYGTQLSAEARKLGVETAKKMGVGA
jgi:hypothetical protein